MKTILLLCTILSFSTSILDAAASFPSSFPRCKGSDPNVDKCLSGAIQTAIRIATEKGIPEVHIPKLDALRVPKMTLDTQGTTVRVLQKYDDIKLYGFSKSIVTKAHWDSNKKVLTFTMFAPHLRQISSYLSEGRILVLPLYGNGTADLGVLNSTIDHTIAFEEKTTKSGTFFNVSSHTVKWVAKGLTFNVDNLFNGNKLLSDNMLQVLNENGLDVWNDAQTGIEIAYGEVFQGLSRPFFSSIPVDKIFLK